jgi:endonuclease-3
VSPAETPVARRARVRKIIAALTRAHPDAVCALVHRNPYELIMSTILSAQCTDARVNMVTPALFKAYPDAAALAKARPREVEAIIRSTGFFRSKARNLIGCAQGLIADHGGKVPRDMAALVKLPGVGRKTANVVLGVGYGIAVGVVVDTHVRRISRRLGLTRHDDPVRIEQDLIGVVPKESWIAWSHLLIHHGRKTCDARKPLCPGCPVSRWCPSAGKV